MTHSLTLHVEFLTGRCVAAQVHDRDRAEWPPHPGRVFMALAATCFETGESPDEVAALEWLESLPAPEVHASEHRARTPVKFYVPVNDRISPTKSVLQSTPGLPRSKQERAYPTAIPFDPLVRLVWPRVEGAEPHREPLGRLCANVIRVGHSSSLVRVWIDCDPAGNQPEAAGPLRRWRPSSGLAGWRARTVSAGELKRLRTSCDADRIERFAQRKQRIESTKGKQQKEARQEFESEFGQPYKASLRPPEPTPPVLGLWQGYQRVGDDQAPPDSVAGSCFDPELLILAKQAGPTLTLEDSLALASRLRQAAMSHCPQDPPPAWLSGHDPVSRQPIRQPHTAFLPLPFVGHSHADGRLLGLALALPGGQHAPPEQRGPLIGPLLLDRNGEPRDVVLKLGRLGVWTLRLEERAEPPAALRGGTWTRPSRQWASVTPVVLDRFPKASRSERRTEWEAEVRRIVTQACVQAGLPEPLEVDIDTTSWHIGVPRAHRKTRPLRDAAHVDGRAPLGDGFPFLHPTRPGKPPRPQVHVFLRFAAPVQGPVLLGAGRFFGYGMCKPFAPRRTNG